MKLVLSTVYILCLFGSNPTKGDIFDFLGGAFLDLAKVVDAGASNMINKWIDSIVDNVLTDLRKPGAGVIRINPAKFPLIQPTLGMDLSALIFDITLTGIDTLSRIGPAAVKTDVQSASVLVKFDAGLTNLTLNASMELSTFFKLKPPVSISGTLGYGRAKVVVRVGRRLTRSYVNLVSFNLTEIGNLTLKFEGLGSALNGIVEKVSLVIFNALKEPIRVDAERPLRNALGRALDNV